MSDIKFCEVNCEHDSDGMIFHNADCPFSPKFYGLSGQVGDLKKQNQDLRKQVEEAISLMQKFVDHYNERKITNGYHDLLSKEYEKFIKEIKDK